MSGFQSAGPRRRVNAPFRHPRRQQPVVFARRNIRVGGFTGMELKFLDAELTTTNITAAWTPLNPTGTGCTDSLSVPAQGNGEEQRDGRVYTMDTIMVRGVLRQPSVEANGTPAVQNRVRVIMYLDKQTNSSEAVATDIMDAGATDDIVAFRNLQNSHRFRVLADKTYTFRALGNMNEGGANLFAIGQQQISFKFYHKFKGGLRVQTDGTTANVSSVTDNNVGIAAIMEVGGGAVATTISYTSRLRFRG